MWSRDFTDQSDVVLSLIIPRNRTPAVFHKLKMAESSRKRLPKQTNFRPFQLNEAVRRSLHRPPLGYVLNSHLVTRTYRFEEELKTYVPLLRSLEDALSKPVFCCGGSVRPPNVEKLSLKVKLPTAEEDKAWREFSLSDLAIDELRKYCKPAPFGDLKEMKTVLDSEVRLAYEVESNSFIIGESSTSRTREIIPEVLVIRGRIEDTLTPGRDIVLDRYKLNVYSEGGFFKPHVDSPSGDNMIGTLVLCLPSPHKGGELCVNHDGLQHVFDFSQHSGDRSRIQWAAFYSDCLHEVKPVTEGHRITITYKITVPEKEHKSRLWEVGPARYPVDEHFETSAESPSLTANTLAKVNSELETIRQWQGKGSPSRVGFLLMHKYVSRGLQPHLLKGEDKGLFEFLVEKQWKCKLMSVLSRFQTSIVYLEEDLDLDETHEVYELITNMPTTAPLFSELEVLRNYMPRNFRQWRVGIPFIDVYRRADDDGQLVRNNEGEGKWIGNDVEGVGVDKIYLDSAVIVELSHEP